MRQIIIAGGPLRFGWEKFSGKRLKGDFSLLVRAAVISTATINVTLTRGEGFVSTSVFNENGQF
jgi:hypothetical protein